MYMSVPVATSSMSMTWTNAKAMLETMSSTAQVCEITWSVRILQNRAAITCQQGSKYPNQLGKPFEVYFSHSVYKSAWGQ